MRAGKATYVFPGSNTPAGFLSFYREGLKSMENVFILKGGPGCGKSTIMRKIGNQLMERGYDVEFWQCSSDNDSLDGVLIPAISAAVVDGTPPHSIDPQYPGAVEEIINLGEHWQTSELRRQRQEIIALSQHISSSYAACYDILRQAAELCRAERAQQNVDEAQLAAKTEALADAMFCRDAPRSRHLFASAVTPRGLISFTEPLSRRAAHRYIICGPNGGGKERLIGDIAHLAEQRGHYAELYHHTLYPDEIELLYLPDLSAAVLTTVQRPEQLREGDTVIECGEVHDAEAAAQIQRETTAMTAQAAEHIATAKELHDQLEAYYRKAMDFAAVDAAGMRLLNRMITLAAEKQGN